MFIFQTKRLKPRFNYVVTFLFENAKNLGRPDDAQRRKKEDGLKGLIEGCCQELATC